MNRALLLTDVVDSTKLSEELGDAAMAELWARHDRVARDLLPVHDGREIDKTDGFLMLFDAATDAVAYAVAYHRALRALGIAARAGIHVGPVILTENAPADVARGAKPLEVDGIAKPTAARVMSVAMGGQTLLTEAARAALGETDLRVESHGHWRMKGVSDLMELFEIGDDAAPFRPPPDGAKVYRVVVQDGLWLPVQAVKHSLPAERDAFVGRATDLQALDRLLDPSRLVSVLGMGGTGKTRLVTRFGWTWLGDYPGGVWFCDLSEARDLDGIASSVARALDVPLGEGDPIVQLGHAIAGRGSCLVILDNFEQVAPLAPSTLGRWLDRASRARFVVTTREILGLPGETALALAPLASDESFELFVARAQQAKPGFEPTDPESIRALVRLLDGLPLAIELAAARVRVMPPKTVLQRMSERFKLLASSGGRHSRQSTLRGALDWSWDLLSTDEQAALAQLSVFEGGFTLETVEGVLALGDLWPMDAVQALVDKSLVRPISDERFDLLVSVQDYADEKLSEMGGREEAQERHGAWFARLGEWGALDALATHGGVERFQSLARERENLVAACRRSVTRGDGESAVALLRAAWAVIARKGPGAQGLELSVQVAGLAGLSRELGASVGVTRAEALRLAGRTDEALAQLEVALSGAREVGDRVLESRALAGLGALRLVQGRGDEAGEYLEAALSSARELGVSRVTVQALLGLGVVCWHQSRIVEARERYEAALTVVREAGDRASEGRALMSLGIVHAVQGRHDEARDHLDAALTIAREVGDRRFEGQALGNLGNLHRDQGRMDEACACYEAALVVHREVGDRPLVGTVLGKLGEPHRIQGRMDDALACFDASLAIHREVGDRNEEAHVLVGLGSLSADQGRVEDALARYEAALVVFREVGNTRFQSLALGQLGRTYLGVGRLEEARAYIEASLTVAREAADRMNEANALCALGEQSRAEGRLDEARGCFEASLAVAREIRYRRLEGHLLGFLGSLDLAQGRTDQASANLAAAELALREVGDRLGLANVRCARVRVEVAAGDLEAARAALSEAEALAAALGAYAESRLAGPLAEARAALESP